MAASLRAPAASVWIPSSIFPDWECSVQPSVFNELTNTGSLMSSGGCCYCRFAWVDSLCLLLDFLHTVGSMAATRCREVHLARNKVSAGWWGKRNEGEIVGCLQVEIMHNLSAWTCTVGLQYCSLLAENMMMLTLGWRWFTGCYAHLPGWKD